MSTPEGEASQWAPGDLVRLKSGGPKMVVTDVLPSGRVDCTWFLDGAGPNEATFNPIVLERAD